MSRRNAAAYDEDYYAWSQEQARLLREGRLGEIDAENIAEEIESLGRSDWRELKSRIVVLLTHLLKWQYQPDGRSKSWSRTVRVQRRDIADLLKESPALRRKVGDALEEAYPAACEDAADETDLPIETFPAACPYTADELLDPGFWPGPTSQS
jgi:hypothetical protein